MAHWFTTPPMPLLTLGFGVFPQMTRLPPNMGVQCKYPLLSFGPTTESDPGSTSNTNDSTKVHDVAISSRKLASSSKPSGVNTSSPATLQTARFRPQALPKQCLEPSGSWTHSRDRGSPQREPKANETFASLRHDGSKKGQLENHAEETQLHSSRI